MIRYYDLLLGRSPAKDLHPLEAKKQLAAELVTIYHSEVDAKLVLADWNSRFSERRLTDVDLPKLTARNGDAVTIVVDGFAACGVARSKSEARRLIAQGSVQLDGEKIAKPNQPLELAPGNILRLDKTHAVRVTAAP